MNRRQRNKLRAASGPHAKGVNTKRGRDYFFVALIVLPIIAGMSVLTGASISLSGAVAIVLGVSVLAAVLGTFTENIGF